VYSQAVREPLDKVDPGNLDLDVWEIILYVMALSFALEDVIKVSTFKAFPSFCTLTTKSGINSFDLLRGKHLISGTL
jgi:hypothetical protein